ncbi:MAG: putative lipid II flippase FtsW [Gemmatimonadota bacterium]|nr:MAG: putative lipid II flippase FtsW [Gemmatimonadota bacterium]
MRDLAGSVTVDAYVPAAGSARRDAGMLLAVTVLLLLIGLITVYSASSFLAQKQGLPDHFYLQQQASKALVGLLALYVLARVDYRIYRRLAWPLLGTTVLALFLVVLPGTEAIAPPRHGARRWLELGVRIQPSELAKLVMVIWAAALAAKKGARIRSLRWGLAAFGVVYLAVGFLIMLEPDLSSAVLIGLLCAIVLFAAGARVAHFGVVGLLALPLFWEWVRSASYRMARITSFFNAGTDPTGAGYQLKQSLIAVGSGGLFGVGYGESTQKYYFLPEPHNDFAFAIIAEEWGLVGTAAVVLAVAALGVLGLRIARRAPDAFGFLLAVGLTALIVVSALIHICVTLGLLPTTGVTLPFISYGGSNLVISLAAVGILLNIGSWRA